MNLTSTQKYQVVKEILSSKNSIKGFMNSIEYFEDLKTILTKFTECFDEFEQKESDRIRVEEEKKAHAEEVLELIKSRGLSVEEFNRLMLRSGNIEATALTEITEEKVSTGKTKARRTNPVYVLEYEHEGQTLRTPLKPLVGRRGADIENYMKSLELNPSKKEDCIRIAVNPTEAEIQEYLSRGGCIDLIQYPEGEPTTSQEDIDVDAPEESFGNA